MEVEVLRSTDNPERLVCQAARGDYFEGYVGDTPYSELMADVDYDETHLENLHEIIDRPVLKAETDPFVNGESEIIEDELMPETILEAKTRSFIERQLSRGHYGPWEHPQITFAVKGVSRVTMAQITRHRHMTFDIQSMRYADFSEQEIVTPKSLTDPDHFTRETGETEIEDRERLVREYNDMIEDVRSMYQWMVNSGVPKEDARFLLPLGTTVNMTFSGNARTFLHLLNLRAKASAQWEIRELSNKLVEELMDWMPYTYSWYEQNKPHKIGP